MSSAGSRVVGLGMPAFWFGIVLIEVFALHLQAAAGRRLGQLARQHLEGLDAAGV